MSPTQEPRLHPWPPITSRNGTDRIAATVLTPLRMTLLYEFVYRPAKTAWKLAALALTGDVVFELLKGYSFLDRLTDIDRTLCVATMIVVPLLLLSEVALRFPVTRTLIGRRVSIRFTEDSITIPRLVGVRSYSRSDGISFALSQPPQTNHPIYRNALELALVLSDARVVPIAEIFDQRLATKLVSNCNVLASSANHSEEHDIDPRKIAGVS